MSSIPVLKFLFHTEWKTLSEALGINPQIKTDEFITAPELCTYLSDMNASLILTCIRNKEDLIQLATFIKLSKKMSRDTLVKIVVFNLSNDKSFEKACNKLGIMDVMDEKINTKALRFKADFWLKSLNAQLRNHSATANNSNAARTVITQDKALGAEKKLSESPPVNWVAPIEIEDDMWLSRHESDCKKILSRWMVKLIGPSPYVGNWHELGDSTYVWKFDAKCANKDFYLPQKGEWFFRGDQKPDFNWKENQWLISGSSFELFCNVAGAPVMRMQLKDKVLTIAKNSEYALTKEQIIVESFDRDLVIKRNAVIASGKEVLDGGEADVLKNMQGKGKTEQIDNGVYTGKNKSEDTAPGSMSAKQKNEDKKPGFIDGQQKGEEAKSGYMGGKLKGEEQQGQGAYAGKQKGEEAKPGHMGGKLKGEEIEGQGAYAGKQKGEEAKPGHMGGKLKGEEQLGQGAYAGKQKGEEAKPGHIGGKLKGEEIEGQGSYAGKQKGEEAKPGHLGGKLKGEEHQGQGPYDGKQKGEEAKPGHMGGKTKGEEAHDGPLAGKTKGDKALPGHLSSKEKEEGSSSDFAGKGALSGKSQTDKLKQDPLGLKKKSEDSLMSTDPLEQKSETGHEKKHWGSKNAYQEAKKAELGFKSPSDKLPVGEQLELDNNKKSHEKYMKGHNPAEQFEAKDGLGGKGNTDHLDKNLSSREGREKLHNGDDSNKKGHYSGQIAKKKEDSTKPFANVLPFTHKKNDWEDELDPDLERATQDAKVVSTIAQGNARYHCELDDFFDQTLIFRMTEEGINGSKPVKMDLSFNYLNKLTEIKIEGAVSQVDSDGEGTFYVTVEIGQDHVKSFDEFNKIYKERQGNVDFFMSKAKGIA